MMDQRGKWMVANRLEKRSLLIAANCLAGMSIFFFGELALTAARCIAR